MFDLTIRWKDEDGTWKPFDLMDIAHLPVSHACYLFSHGTLVVAKEDGHYIVNNAELAARYRRDKKPVTTFDKVLQDVARIDLPLGKVGFVSSLA